MRPHDAEPREQASVPPQRLKRRVALAGATIDIEYQSRNHTDRGEQTACNKKESEPSFLSIDRRHVRGSQPKDKSKRRKNQRNHD